MKPERDISLRTVLKHYFTNELTALPPDFYLAQYNMVRNTLLTITKENSTPEPDTCYIRTPDDKYEFLFDGTRPNYSRIVIHATMYEDDNVVYKYTEMVYRDAIRQFIFNVLDPITASINNYKEHPSLSVEKWTHLLDQLLLVDKLFEGYPNPWKDVLQFLTEKLERDFPDKFPFTHSKLKFSDEDSLVITGDEQVYYPIAIFKYMVDSDTTFSFHISTIDLKPRPAWIGTDVTPVETTQKQTNYEERFDVISDVQQLFGILKRKAGIDANDEKVCL